MALVHAGRIDTHLHALPPDYIAALAAAGGDPSGFPTPDWSLNATINSMNSLGTSIGELTEHAHPTKTPPSCILT